MNQIYQHTGISLAVENSEIDKLIDFIEAGDNIYKDYGRHYEYDYGENLLIKSCRLNNIEIFEILLKEYEKDYQLASKLINENDNELYLLQYIFLAYGTTQLEKVKQLLITEQTNEKNKSKVKQKKILIILKDKISSCISLTINENNKEILTNLIENGLVNLNIVDTIHGNTPAIYVLQQNRLDLFKRMIKIGLNINLIRNVPTCIDVQKSKSIFEETISKTVNCEIIEYILNLKSKENKENLLLYTASNENIEVFDLILNYLINEEKSKILQTQETNQKIDEIISNIFNLNPTFLFEIIECKNFNLLNYIIKYQFNYNISNARRQTPLHLAIQYKECFPFVKEILSRGQDITHKFETSESILDNIFETSGNEILLEIIKYIPDNFFYQHYAKCIELIILGIKFNIDVIKKYAYEIDPNATYDQERNTALLLSIIYPCEELFYILIEQNGDLTIQNLYDDTSLYLATKYSTKNIIRFIMKKESTLINIFNSIKWSPLTEIINRDDDNFLDIFNELINLNCNPFLIDNEQNSLLHHAVLKKNIDIVKCLLEIGIDPNIQDKNKSTALHISTKCCDTIDIFKLILNTGRVDIELKNYRGNTILHNVSKSYFSFFCDILFEHSIKPNVNARNNNQQTAIHLCFDSKRYHKLIENGAEISPLDENNCSPYICYAYEWRCDCLIELLKRTDIDFTIITNDNMTLLNCLPNVININDYIENERVKDMFRKTTNIESYNKTAVFEAVANRNLERLKLMFELSETIIDLDKRDDQGKTILFYAYRSFKFNDNFNIIKYLIEKGINVNAVNNNGDSILFEIRSVQLMKILLDNGAYVNLKNNNGRTPLHQACEINHFEEILLLINYSANLNTTDNKNMKPLDLCTDKFIIDFITRIFC